MTNTMDLAGEPGFDEVAPEASAMIESMRAHGYTLPAAVADLIDNSIAAGATEVSFHAEWGGRDSWITLTDNGSGMSAETLRDAMRLGSRSPLLERDPRDLGRFGLGLKTASLSQCRRLTVASRIAGQEVAIRRWDLDHIAREDVTGWQLLRAPAEGSSDRLSKISDMESGTVVLWELLDRVAGDSDPSDEESSDHFLDQVDQVAVHLAMVFHRFLSRQARGLSIKVNGHQLAPWDPFLEGHPATDSTPIERIPLLGGEVCLRGFVLPHKDHLGEEPHRGASGPSGWNAQQGFYVYRNERLIVPGSWLGLGTGRPWTKEEHYKLARIRVDIPNTMDHLWQLDVKKSSAIPPTSIKHRLKQLADGVRKDAREVFAHRGKYGPREKREEIRRPWKSRETAQGIAYLIDRKHPLIQAILNEHRGKKKKRIESMLRVVEETVPVERIWLDSSEKPDSPVRPFTRATEHQVQNIIKVVYEAIRENGQLTHDQAVGILLAMEEFSDHTASISSLEEPE